MLLVGDAMAVGGPALVEELHYAAMKAAGAVVPWDVQLAEREPVDVVPTLPRATRQKQDYVA